MKFWKNKYKLSHIVYLILFISLLSTMRLYLYEQLSSPSQPAVKQGVLDLRGVETDESKTFLLDGEWEFYANQWIGASNRTAVSKPQLLQLPSNLISTPQTGRNVAYEYGTYHVRIVLDQPLSEPLNVMFRSIHSFDEVEINGELLAKSGIMAMVNGANVDQSGSFIVTYGQAGATMLDIFVRTVNYEPSMKGGIVELKPVQFGNQDVINRFYYYSNIFQLLVFVIFLLHGMYALILFLMNVRKMGFLIFALMMMTAALTVGVKHDGLLFVWLHVNFEWTMKLTILSYTWFSFFTLLMGRELFGIQRRGIVFISYTCLLITYSLLVIFGSPKITLYSVQREYYMLLYYVPLLWATYYFLRMVLLNGVGALFLLFSAISVLNNIIWGNVYYTGTSQFMFYPLDLLAAITSFSAYWFKRYFYHSKQNELLNSQLSEATKLKDRFLANTSHELRTPLHGIMNIAQSVLNRKKPMLDEQSQYDMELLIRISRRMSFLVNDLLDVVRLQEKQITLCKTSVQLQSLAPGVMDMLRFLNDGGTQTELHLNIQADLPHVYADEARLLQIIVNLLHNALKNTPQGSIELAAVQEGKYVRVYVRDTGIGMDAATLDRVFARYEQGAYGSGGIGLGLSICKELVELHNSELTVQSKPDEGSVFSFKLPIISAIDEKLQSFTPPIFPGNDTTSVTSTEVRTAQEAAASYDGKELEHLSKFPGSGDRIRILAVDDDPINLKVLTRILYSDAYFIETAHSARDALEKLNDEAWDLIIADVMMPDMSGYELTQLIRKRFTLYELPVILLTARAEPEDIYAGFLAGANDYVTKPVDAMELKYRAWSLSTLKQAVNERLSMEAAYLQAQIHPHFLFNTLNSIVALSDIDSKKMRALVEAFTSYLRISFGFLTAGKLVPLSRELELVKNYLYIEQQRFAERLQVSWEVNVDTQMLIPPLTIQPLVENAVRHGLLKRVHGGILHIRIEKQTDVAVFSVIDNGIGLTDKQLSELLNPGNKTKSDGIGLLNTHARLTRFYGKGLEIQSKLGEGTTVSFVFPGRST